MKQDTEPIFARIHASYFTDHPDLEEILEKENRIYIGVIIEMNHCKCFIPLRTEILTDPKFSKAFFPIPYKKRPNAGLDFRKLLIITDDRYVSIQNRVQISKRQKEKIYSEYSTICKRLNSYVHKYIKEAKRGRAHSHHLYRFSTLKNYHEELGLEESLVNNNLVLN